MRLKALSALIFDLDGTLVNSEPAWEAAKRETLARHGVDVSQAVLDDYVGRGIRGFLTATLGTDAPDAFRAQVAAEIGAMADRLLPEIRQPIPGAAAFVADVAAAGVRVAVCSSSPRRHIVAALDQLGVADRVQVIVSGAELPRGKPDPLPYLETLSLMRLAPEHAAAVEDAVPGFHSATGAGLAVIGIGEVAMRHDHRSSLALAVPDFAALSARFHANG